MQYFVFNNLRHNLLIMKTKSFLFFILSIFGFHCLAVEPPTFKFKPDTIINGGEVRLDLTCKNYEGFSVAEFSIIRPNNNYFTFEWVKLNTADIITNETFYYPIEKYDANGKYRIESIRFYSADYSYDTTVYLENIGFYVQNTLADTTGPRIFNFKSSKEIAVPGDTVFISFEAEDTLSGLATYDLSLLDSPFDRSDYFEQQKNAKLDFQYVINKYETSGQRHVLINICDDKNNCSDYNNDSLNFELEIRGTIPDTIPPTIKSVYSAEDHDSLFLYIVAYDSLSGIKDSFYSSIVNFSPFQDYYLPAFTKINDTLLSCNLTLVNPYIASGDYNIDIEMSDKIGNFTQYTGTVTIDNKNSDILAPEIVSVKLDKDTVFSDGKLGLEIRITDNKSGIILVYINITADENRKTLLYEQAFEGKIVIDTTIQFNIKLPEFGPSGKWKVSIIYVRDRVQNMIRKTVQLPSFVYYPKYLDINPPVLESITFEPDPINAGDTVTITIKAFDDESGIAQIDYIDDLIVDDCHWQRVGDKTYQTKIPVNKYAASEVISYKLYSITDIAGNINELNLGGNAYSVVKNGSGDNTSPQFDSLKITPVIAGENDTIKLHFYLHDDISGIYAQQVAAMFSPEDVDDIEKSKGVFFMLNELNTKEYTYSIVPGIVKPGKYFFTMINVSDSAGNIHRMDSESFFNKGYYFEIPGEPMMDTIAPKLISLKANPEQAAPGENVEFEIKVLEKESSLLLVNVTLNNVGGVDIYDMLFDDWKITESNDTFTCKASLTVPLSACSGKCHIWNLGLYDFYLNSYFIEQDSVEVFEVIHGQEIPNRKPNYLIRDMSFTMNAGTTLNYAVPGYLVSDIDGDPLNFSAKMRDGSELPSWITFTSDNQSLSFNPTNDNAGKHYIHLYATDPDGLKDSIEVRVRVNKVTPPVSVIQVQYSQLKVYPNPAADILTIECPFEVQSIALYDLSGQVVIMKSGSLKNIIVSSINKGIYILKVETDQMTLVEKIIIK
jgi:hypothetical protein